MGEDHQGDYPLCRDGGGKRERGGYPEFREPLLAYLPRLTGKKKKITLIGPQIRLVGCIISIGGP